MRKLIATIAGIAMCGVVMSAQAAGDAAKGKTTYAEKKCSVCHKTGKDDAKGSKMASMLSESAAKLSAADIKGWLTDTAKMEAKLPKKPAASMVGPVKNAKLTDADVANLVAYIQSLK